jgi:hypothetical protein
MASGSTVRESCEKHFEAYKNDCSGFVAAVAGDFGIRLIPPANAIVRQLQELPWLSLGHDGSRAKTFADDGWLVIAGKENAGGHGHVAVVVSGPLALGKYPTAYWGSLGGTPRKEATINWSWRADDRDEVLYAAYAIGGLLWDATTGARNLA